MCPTPASLSQSPLWDAKMAELTAAQGSPRELPTIEVASRRCFLGFQKCAETGESIHLRQRSMLEDQLTRFTLWTNNMGVFAEGRASMDHRLRETPDVRVVVVCVLETLFDHIDDCAMLVPEDGSEDAPIIEEMLDRVLQGMAGEISMLFSVSNIIRRASRESQNIKADEENTEVDPLLQQRFLWHVRGRFPTPHEDPDKDLTPEQLTERLGWERLTERLASTMLLRRKRVLYRRSRYGSNPIRTKGAERPTVQFPMATGDNKALHKPVLSRAIPSLDRSTSDARSHAPSTVSFGHSATTLSQKRFQKASTLSVISASRTVALTNQDALDFPQPPLSCFDEQYQKKVEQEWRKFIEGLEEILGDIGTSTASERMVGAVEALDLALKEAFQACITKVVEFTCPICFHTLPGEYLTIKSKCSHITGDLDAYVCLFEKCDSPRELYTHSSTWMSHMDEHARRWSCIAKSHGKRNFETKEEYIDHMKGVHPGSFTDGRLELLTDRSSWTPEQLFDSCPLCGGNVGADSMKHHIVTHLRALALTSLPPEKKYDPENPHHDNDSLSSHSSQLSITPTIADYTSDQGDQQAQDYHLALEVHEVEEDREPPEDERAEEQLREGILHSPWQCLPSFADPPHPPPAGQWEEDPTIQSLLKNKQGTFGSPESICETKEVARALRKLRKLVGKQRADLVKSRLEEAGKDVWVEDEVKEGVWGYIFPLDTKYGRRVVLRVRGSRPLPAKDRKNNPLSGAEVGSPDSNLKTNLRSRGYLIGRHPECDIVVDDPTASNRHCLIFPEHKNNGTVVFVEDLSGNGTFVNEALVDRRKELQETDEIAVTAGARFIFRYPKSRSTSAFAQQYTLLENIGKTDISEILACVEKSSGHRYGVRVFSKTRTSEFEGLQAEIATLMGISHPNILNLKDVFNEVEAVYLVLEPAFEGDLYNFIVTRKSLTEAESRNLFTQLFCAVKYLHDRGIVHRDIKPEKILFIDKDNLQVKLADFALSQIIGEETFMTRLCGTPSYVAPEILADRKDRKYTKAVDVWSLGVVLYICLCGFPPFSDDLTTESFPYNLSQQIRTGRFDYPSPYWDSVGDPALDLIDSMLVVDPEKRYTVDQCLAHPWMRQSQPSVNDGSNDEPVEDLAGLKRRTPTLPMNVVEETAAERSGEDAQTPMELEDKNSRSRQQGPLSAKSIHSASSSR
ncbi:hypothetical protein RB598_001599 [Gaeumannomyces tritici]